jgi:hypothetical protein
VTAVFAPTPIAILATTAATVQGCRRASLQVKTKISQQWIEQLQPPDLAAFFKQSGSVSKLPTRLISRLCGTTTGTDEFVGELLEVGTKLFREGSAPFSPSPKRE